MYIVSFQGLLETVEQFGWHMFEEMRYVMFNPPCIVLVRLRAVRFKRRFARSPGYGLHDSSRLALQDICPLVERLLAMMDVVAYRHLFGSAIQLQSSCNGSLGKIDDVVKGGGVEEREEGESQRTIFSKWKQKTCIMWEPLRLATVTLK